MNAAPYFGVIDIGNSGIKASLVDAQSLQLTGPVKSIHWRMPNDLHKTPPVEFQSGDASWATIDDCDAIGKLLDELALRELGHVRRCVWVVSSVQPTAFATLKRALSMRSSECQCRLVGFRDIPMVLEVDSPESVGIDRLLAAWGAWQASDQQRPLIVIQAGTAVTVDWVDEQGTYGGGAIMPGLSLTLKYLALGTAHLPWLAPPKDPTLASLPGKNTRDAILAGVSASFIGGIEQLQRKYRQQYLGDPNSIETIISGGDGMALSQSIVPPFKAIDHLVLNALARLRLEKASDEFLD
jgi:type III pantothenate kinase